MTLDRNATTQFRTQSGGGMEAACRTEIVRHHEVIQRWINGKVSRTASDFATFADAHTPDFTLIEPSGTTLTRVRVFAAVKDAYGADPDLEISITDVTVVTATDTAIVATYKEHHHHPDGPTQSRHATVVFIPSAETMRWRHLHETRIVNA